MVTLMQTVRPHPEVVDTELDSGETVPLHLECTTYSLSVTSTRIRLGLKRGLTLHAISTLSMITARYAEGRAGI